jgi:hypothetical protein
MGGGIGSAAGLYSQTSVWTGIHLLTAQNRPLTILAAATLQMEIKKIEPSSALRADRLQQRNITNFNGRFIFSAIPGGLTALGVYQQNQILASQGVAQPEIVALGFDPSEFLVTAGIPAANGAVYSRW